MEWRLAIFRGGVIDLDTDLVKLRPLRGPLPLLLRTGEREGECLRSRARSSDGERDLE